MKQVCGWVGGWVEEKEGDERDDVMEGGSG